jgi:DNA invertase Pin-like site-specific DNA recombinase
MPKGDEEKNKTVRATRDNKIRKLHSKGVSYRELAERFGLSKSHVSKICQNPNMERTDVSRCPIR